MKELNDKIYARAKLVSEKIGDPFKNTRKNLKPGWEFRLEIQIRYLRQQAKKLRRRKNEGISWDEKEQSNAIRTNDTTRRD